MSTSFDNKKSLKFAVTIAGTAQQIVIQGFRATVDIANAGGVAMNNMSAKIYGVSQKISNQLTSMQFQPAEIKRNSIEVYAVDGAVETLIYIGNIGNCWMNFSQMPDVYLEIQAFSGLLPQLQPVPPTSYQGTVDVALAMSQLATTMGFQFENSLLTPIVLKNPYLAGTAWDQMLSLANQAPCDVYLDVNTLAICTLLNPRQITLPIPLISAQSGLVGYPTFGADNRGPSINLTVLFNPAIRFGGQVQIVTSQQAAINQVLTSAQRANGLWIVNSIGHSLSSELPGGPWFSHISAGKIRLVGAST